MQALIHMPPEPEEFVEVAEAAIFSLDTSIAVQVALPPEVRECLTRQRILLSQFITEHHRFVELLTLFGRRKPEALMKLSIAVAAEVERLYKSGERPEYERPKDSVLNYGLEVTTEQAAILAAEMHGRKIAQDLEDKAKAAGGG